MLDMTIKGTKQILYNGEKFSLCKATFITKNGKERDYYYIPIKEEGDTNSGWLDHAWCDEDGFRCEIITKTIADLILAEWGIN